MSQLKFTYIIPHTISMSLLALMALLASCAGDEIDVPSGTRTIRFEVSTDGAWSRTSSQPEICSDSSLTTIALKSNGQELFLIPEITPGIEYCHDKSSSRSEAVTNNNISDFGVYASIGNNAEGYYMRNVEVTKENSWAPAKEYLWPGNGSLHITAYSPYCGGPNSENGITALLDGTPTNTAPKLEYAVAPDVIEQTDLLWAIPRDASESPCEIKFNHALAAVRFVAGSEMAPCTVKSITIGGLLGSGTLDLEDGTWTNVSGNESYTASVNTVLSASDGKEYAEEGTLITDASHTFFLMPQTLGDEATCTMVIEYEGTEMEFSAGLKGQTWTAGNTYTYHLSASPTLNRFDITVDSPILFNYPGGSAPLVVKSIYETMQNGVLTSTEVPWTAEFIDANGNPISAPEWISMPMSGNGSGEYAVTAKMVEPTFVRISEPSRLLREKPEVGSESSPYNLSNSAGNSEVENTANCYVINAPGTYSIPLVYGNAIKNGADNTAAYAPTRSSAPFVNHLGNRIKHPYIYENEGCENPTNAVLVWEGRLNMIHNLHLSADGKTLVFELPRAYIRQGNALVGVTDDDGNIMWSWQLWITDYVPGNDMSTLTYNGSNFEVMPYNMGHVVGGDEVDFANSTALIRFTQQPANGAKGNFVDVTVEQKGKHIITPECNSYYQWGRKDPMISGIKEWYNADHTEITQINTQSVPTVGNKVEDDFDALCVTHPQVFWVSNSSSVTFKYTNNWNMGTSTHRVKTVYDPCPAGFMVPGNEMMAFRDLSDENFSFTPSEGSTSAAGFSITCSSGPNLFFPALGYRSGNSGNESISDASNGNLTAVWTSHANTREGSALILTYQNGALSHPLRTDPRLEGFAVRPIRE